MKRSQNFLHNDRAAYYHSIRAYNAVSNLFPDEYLDQYQNGYFVREFAEYAGFAILEADYREIIDVSEQYIPADVIRAAGSHRFSFSINKKFDEVVDACCLPYHDDGFEWACPVTKEILSELHHDRGIAHSVETYQQDELIGGLVGFQQGSMFVMLSLFDENPDASRAAYAFLKKVLFETGFTVLDCIEPCAVNREFGSRTVSDREFLDIRSAALEGYADFSSYSGDLTLPKITAPPRDIRGEEFRLRKEKASHLRLVVSE